ncbi:MAG: hypothetical protein LBR91_03740 [Puniceicoccales bacterium]|jgi:hypothetical protein|nr:hypothetical protein [Puniceicoccales bacterium]
MAFTNEKLLIMALIAPIFVATMFIIGTRRTVKKLGRMTDASMQGTLLRNFSQREWRAKVALCTIVSVMYAFALAGTSISDGQTVKMDVVPHLLQIIILLLAAESASTGRKKHNRL